MEWICVANSLDRQTGQEKRNLLHGFYLVGLMIRAPISSRLCLVSRLTKRSRIGMTNARVFPEPVTASTTTSLFFMKRAIVDACTGVIWEYPRDCITSKLDRISFQHIWDGSRLKILHPCSEGSWKRGPEARKSGWCRHESVVKACRQNFWSHCCRAGLCISKTHIIRSPL